MLDILKEAIKTSDSSNDVLRQGSSNGSGDSGSGSGSGQNGDENVKSVVVSSTFARSIAWVTDFAILMIPRSVVIVIANVFVEQMRMEFMQDVIDRFESFVVFASIGTKQQMEFLVDSAYGKALIIVFAVLVLIAVAYNIVMLNSSWGCTFGQKLASIKIVKMNTLSNVGVFDSILRTLLSYFPWFLPALIVAFWFKYTLLSVICIILLAFWYDVSLFFSARRAIHDLISGTIVINEKTTGKLYFF